MIPSLQNPRKYKLIYRDRKQTRACLMTGVLKERGEGKRLPRGTRKLLRVVKQFPYFDCDDGFMNVYIYQKTCNCKLLICA